MFIDWSYMNWPDIFCFVELLYIIFLAFPCIHLDMVTPWKRHQGSWIEFGKRNVWVLKWVVSGTFADPAQDPDLQCLRVRKIRVKAQRDAVQAGAQAGAGARARAYPGEIRLQLIC
ncbi:hypothetical protein F2P56_018501 [Juglans regia]|uniref:Uncharacterized protein n=1 Tax=Juglans regia TaxID=51240 RepID=A0A833UIX5_JUGRE|nr:hypothetical protein F2P56_018501 [Juglans regia]